MTTKRTYQCNLCHTHIGTTPEATKGRGVYFTGGTKAPWFEYRSLHEAENHLCEVCIETMLSISSTTQESK